MSAKGPALAPGDWLAGTKYQIVRQLGAGGMGVVYQVVKPPNIGGVLKLMSSELTRHEEHRTRFFDEVRILAQLDHPNIVKVFDYDALPDGTPFYVMELLSGRTVRDVIYTMGRVPPRVAYEITRQLLEALQCAHTHEVPVIHRDIKPENIFLHAPRHGDPRVILIDFGVSSVGDRTHDGGFVGTWSYAAPEQIRGDRPTPATDLYAAGLVLYEMLAGVGPFDHYSEWTDVSDAQLHEIPAPVSKFAPWVPASIVTLIASALAKDPSQRPRDAYAFAERLFELEWATDGKDPHDATVHGPAPRPPSPPPASARSGMPPAPAPAPPIRPAPPPAGGRSGAIAFALSTVSSNPSSKNMAAASPASDRLGDVPLIGVPPESVRRGPTWRGVGDAHHEPTSPDADALLAGLGAAPRRPGSRRERASGPDLAPESSPRPGQVVIRAGRHYGEDHAGHGPTTPRALPVRRITAPTLDSADPPIQSPLPARAFPARDTFSSQASDTPPAARARAGIAAVAGATALVFVVALVAVIVRMRSDTGAATNASPPRAPASSHEETASNAGPSAAPAPPVHPLSSAAESVATASSSSPPKPSAKPVVKAGPSAARPTPPSAAPASSSGDLIRHF